MSNQPNPEAPEPLNPHQEQSRRLNLVQYVARGMGYIASKFSGKAIDTNLEASPDLIDKDILRNFEIEHFAKEAPLLREIAKDETRTHLFTYAVSDTMTRGQSSHLLTEKVTMSAHEGLMGLYGFLDESVHSLEGSETDENGPNLVQQASKLRDELSFIDTPELQEATRGIALLWKKFLGENPKHQLCVPGEVIRTNESSKKSSEFILEKILQNFTAEEQARYSKQIITDMAKLKRDPDLTKIVLVDDWAISGRQLSNGVGQILNSEYFKPEYQSRIEAHLIAASQQQLEAPLIQGRPIPTYAYYKVSGSPDLPSNRPLVTGIHSSVDFGFEKPIQAIVAARNNGNTKHLNMPPLTNIESSYKYD